jgi:NDP-4-keto-2,6-dideoxyhexose 3-C-methyltransferase
VPTHTERTNCRVCEGELSCVIDFGDHYLTRFVSERDDDLPRAPLRLARCSLCGLLQLNEVVDPDLVYREYWYRSGINQTMQRALLNLVRDGIAWHGSGTWVDIGANDGTLLRFVPKSFTRIAYEPALNFEAELKGSADKVIPDYFRADPSLRDVQIITSAAMFYDLDRPDEFVADIAGALAPDGVWINQLNDSPTMIRDNAWDGVCHEHNVYYDLPNLEVLYQRHGLKILRVTHNDVNGGSMRVTAARTEHRSPGLPASDPRDTPTSQQVLRFANRASRWKDRMSRLAGVLPKPIYGYGASTKGGTLLQYLGIPDLLTAVAERNPLKLGLMQAGVWSPIISEDSMRAQLPGTLLVLPWAFRQEFVEREEETMAKGTMLLMPLPRIEMVL